MFEIVAKSRDTRARAGRLRLPFGEVETPAFMPVGTQGVVKSLEPRDLVALGYNLILGNTYHLYLRPGLEVLEAAGGLRGFSGWRGNLLTDSGGFQVFSLASMRKVEADGVWFQSHVDGSKHFLSPEKSIEIQHVIGADILMAFDECPPAGVNRDEMQRSLDLTHRWAARCKSAWDPAKGQLFGIVQGGAFEDLRRESAETLVALGLPGYAIGGVSVGEPKEVMEAAVRATAPLLPAHKPRYLMGVGTPEDIRMAVHAGVDLFDCVLPTRNGRMGTAFTSEGRLNIRNRRFRTDFGPLDPSCGCTTCATYSRAYLRHLYQCREITAARALTLHNLAFYRELLRRIRADIMDHLP